MAQKKATQRLRFVKGVAFRGRDYGPGHKEDTCEVEEPWARHFLHRGVAVLAAGKPAAKKDESK